MSKEYTFFFIYTYKKEKKNRKSKFIRLQNKLYIHNVDVTTKWLTLTCKIQSNDFSCLLNSIKLLSHLYVPKVNKHISALHVPMITETVLLDKQQR